jgi:hypothetical protein
LSPRCYHTTGPSAVSVLHLVEQARLALVARSKKIALELLDRQPHLRDQGLQA